MSRRAATRPRFLPRKVRTRPRTLAAALAALALIAGLPAGSAAAPDPEIAPTAAETGADDLDAASPRGAVRRFLVAARAGDYARAAEGLSLGGIPSGRRDDEGAKLARELKTVLDQELWVDLERLSAAPAGHGSDELPRNRDLVGVIRTPGGPVEILVARVAGPDGTPIWKFASETVQQIPALYDEFGHGGLGRWLPTIFFEGQFLEIQLWQWIALLVVILFAYIISWLIARAFVAAIHPVVARSSTDVDDQILQSVLGPLRVLSGALLFYASLPVVALSVPARQFFGQVTRVAALFAATWLVLRLIDVASDLVEGRLLDRDDTGTTTMVPLGRKAVKALIISLALLASLDSFGFDVTALIAGLGVGGLAIALAAQKTLENLFGGATLIADRPVQVGDFCRFGDKVGTVEEIGMRSTRIRTLERTIITVPNAEFSSLQLENFGKRDMMKFGPRLGLVYATTPDQLRYVLVEIRRMLYAHPKVENEPARVRFVNFGDSSLDIDIFAYVAATDFSEYLGIAEDLNLRIMDIVAASGSSFAFPSTTTYVAKDTGTDPEKTRRAEATVRGWAERRELYLPGFPPEKIAEPDTTIAYPGPGAPPRVTK